MLLKFCNWIPYKKSSSSHTFSFCLFSAFAHSSYLILLFYDHSHHVLIHTLGFQVINPFDFYREIGSTCDLLSCLFCSAFFPSSFFFFCLELWTLSGNLFFFFSLPSFFCLDFHLPDHLPLSLSYTRWGNDGTYANSSFSSGFNICTYIHICKCGCSLGYFVLKSTQQSLHVLVSLSVHRLSF